MIVLPQNFLAEMAIGKRERNKKISTKRKFKIGDALLMGKERESLGICQPQPTGKRAFFCSLHLTVGKIQH